MARRSVELWHLISKMVQINGRARLIKGGIIGWVYKGNLIDFNILLGDNLKIGISSYGTV